MATLIRDKRRNCILLRRSSSPLYFREGPEIAHEKGNSISIGIRHLSYRMYEKLLDWTVNRNDMLAVMRDNREQPRAAEPDPHYMAARP